VYCAGAATSAAPAFFRYNGYMESLKNNTVFITGASSGIGEATAHAFAAQGARLLLCARRMDRLQRIQSDLLAAGALAVHIFALDVSKREAVAKAIASLPTEWKAIDVLVNNAGLSRGLSKLQEDDIDNWDEMIACDQHGIGRGAYYVCEWRGLLRKQGGREVHQRRAEAGSDGNAGAGDVDRSGDGGDGVQRGALSRGHGAGGEGVPEHHAAYGSGCGGCDPVGGEPAGACEYSHGGDDDDRPG